MTVGGGLGEVSEEVGRGVPARPPSSADIRRFNLTRVLQLVRGNAPLTRSALVTASGIGRVTVLDIVAELQEWGFVRESGFAPTGRAGGRPARALEMDDTRLAVGVLRVDADHAALECASLQGRTLFSRRIDLDVSQMGPDRILEDLAKAVEEARAFIASAGTRLVRVSVGCPAYVDASAGVVISSYALGWSEVPVVAELERLVGNGVSFSLDRLANLAIHAERRAGGWPDEQGLVLLFGDVGIGGAYQRNAEVLHGDSGVGTEFGHIVVEQGGRPCFCGKEGCLETYVGLGPLAKALGVEPEVERVGLVAHMLKALQNPDAKIREEAARQGVRLAQGVQSLMSVFDPRVVIFGGHLSALAPLIMPSFWTEFERARDRYSRAGVCVSTLGTSAVMAGGIESAIQHLCLMPWVVE
ncbi:ROK family protein [Streptomyces chiangmaiensis]|uniref:ROK family protein n=1 Tax=Streptomyces chiangmaiensis TaxID=766497 RepID=A0ABU7FWV4_9ACTN|nr:ROK family protein [Streptomyces chiangmaiensis]MED7827574.1 ROK family protein [Streptomyces chiangmaiensis]